MNNTQLTTNKSTSYKAASNKASRSLLTRLWLVTVTASLALATTSGAAANDTAYVDSVHQWGAWELDIEPAAGGLQPQTTRPLNIRNSKVNLRTNSISALAPQRHKATTRSPAPLPVTPPASVPTITPVSPNVPIPIGGPGIPVGGPGT